MKEFAIFIFAMISGMLTRSGVITIEQMILAAWDNTSYSLLFSLAPDLHIYVFIIGLVVLAIVAYYMFEPFILGLEQGSGGLFIALLGYGVGFVAMGFVSDYYCSLVGLPT
jgi:hypothetical protein